VLLQSLLAAKGPIAGLAVKRRRMDRRVAQVLLQSLLAAKRSIAGTTTGAHSVSMTVD
jgi:hypothetical protein